jgi:hypothetical protein
MSSMNITSHIEHDNVNNNVKANSNTIISDIIEISDDDDIATSHIEPEGDVDDDDEVEVEVEEEGEDEDDDNHSSSHHQSYTLLPAQQRGYLDIDHEIDQQQQLQQQINANIYHDHSFINTSLPSSSVTDTQSLQQQHVSPSPSTATIRPQPFLNNNTPIVIPLHCPSCFHSFTSSSTHQPRLLSCQHTICTSCLQTQLKQHNKR